MAANRYAWGDAELVPEGKADRDKMASRTMDKFLRSGAHRTTKPGADSKRS